MMHQIKKFPFNYVPDYNLQIVELPYVDEELSMFVLLPEEATDGSDPLVKVYTTTCNLFPLLKQPLLMSHVTNPTKWVHPIGSMRRGVCLSCQQPGFTSLSLCSIHYKTSYS